MGDFQSIKNWRPSPPDQASPLFVCHGILNSGIIVPRPSLWDRLAKLARLDPKRGMDWRKWCSPNAIGQTWNVYGVVIILLVGVATKQTPYWEGTENLLMLLYRAIICIPSEICFSLCVCTRLSVWLVDYSCLSFQFVFIIFFFFITFFPSQKYLPLWLKHKWLKKINPGATPTPLVDRTPSSLRQWKSRYSTVTVTTYLQ